MRISAYLANKPKIREALFGPTGWTHEKVTLAFLKDARFFARKFLLEVLTFIGCCFFFELLGETHPWKQKDIFWLYFLLILTLVLGLHIFRALVVMGLEFLKVLLHWDVFRLELQFFGFLRWLNTLRVMLGARGKRVERLTAARLSSLFCKLRVLFIFGLIFEAYSLELCTYSLKHLLFDVEVI